MSDFDQKEYRRQKTLLTRAVNAKEPKKIIDVCTNAFVVFDRIGWPDDWTRWQRAKEDAEWTVRFV